MRALATLFFVCFTLSSSPQVFSQELDYTKWKNDIKKFAGDIAKFEKESATLPNRDDWLLVTGSSSIRLWKTVQDDLPEYPVLHRGYGGARFSDLAHYMKRIMSNHQLQGVVVFVANDITGSKNHDKTPELTMEYVESILSDINSHSGNIPVFFIAVTPTNKRWDSWKTVQQFNTLLEKRCQSQENLYYIPTADLYQLADGTPNDALFLEDKLHLNSDGYALWAARIRGILAPVLNR